MLISSQLQIDCVTFEQAQKLKELGFNEPNALAYYDDEGNISLNTEHHINTPTTTIDYEYDYYVAPTYQHAFRWIRNTFRLHHIAEMNRFYLERSLSFEESERRSLDSLLEKVSVLQQ